MADYVFRYRLQSAPEVRLDGSGCVMHDVYAVASSDGQNWVDVPGRHKTIAVPAEELVAALSEPTNGARVAAYKDALASNLDTAPVAITGWGAVQLEALMDANDLAAETAAGAHEFILSVAGSYPVEFAM